MKISIYIPQADELIDALGIGPTGSAQLFHTQNIMRRMVKYMPMQTGMFVKQMVVSSYTEISINAPQARYLYYGKRMVNAATGKGPRWIPGVGYRWPRGAKLVATSEPLNYTTTFHPLAGPYWDKRLVAAEKDVIVQELKDYIGRFGSNGG